MLSGKAQVEKNKTNWQTGAGSFIHPLIQQIFTGCLSCARHGVRPQEDKGEKERQVWTPEGKQALKRQL